VGRASKSDGFIRGWQPWLVFGIFVGLGVWFDSWFHMPWPARTLMYLGSWIAYLLGRNRGEYHVLGRSIPELIRDGTLDAARIPVPTRVGDRIHVTVERTTPGGEWYTVYEDTRVR
jgi:hypothetical protein